MKNKCKKVECFVCEDYPHFKECKFKYPPTKADCVYYDHQDSRCLCLEAKEFAAKKEN